MNQRPLLLSLLAALFLISPALAAPVLASGASSIRQLPGDDAIGPAADYQVAPDIAAGGSLSLIVWADLRASGSGGADIYAARLDANGALLDSIPIRVAQQAADQNMPRVSWNGTNWLVVWTTQDPTDFYYSYAIAAARVSPAGAVLDASPILAIRFAQASFAQFAVANVGTDWAIVTQGSAAGEGGIRGARISSAGVLLDAAPVAIVPEDYFMRAHIELAGAGDELLLTWDDLNDFRGQRLHPNLVPIEAAPFEISGPLSAAQESRLVSNGTDFFLVWEDAVYTTYEDHVRGARISYAGQVLDPGGIALTPNLGAVVGRFPGAAWDGTRWWASYETSTGIRVARITTAGVVQDPAGFAVDAAHAAFHGASDLTGIAGGGVRVAWQDTRAGGNNPDDIYRVGVSATGTPGVASCVSLGAPSQTLPSLARGSSGSMAVFASDVSGTRRIEAHPLDGAGNPLLAAPVLLATGPYLSGPTVAWNGAVYLVTWSDEQANLVYAKRLSESGGVLDAKAITVMPGNTPDVAALDGSFLVADSHAPINPEYRNIYSRRVRGSDGALLDAAPVEIGGSFSIRPHVAAFADRWVVTWSGFFSHDDPHANVHLAFVGADGTLGLGEVLTGPTMYNYGPDVAAFGTQGMVAWHDPRVSNADWNVYARRVLADGTVLDSPGFALTTAPEDQFGAALAWDGSEFVGAFEDRRAVSFFLDTRADIFGSRVDLAGNVIDPDGVGAFVDSLPEKQPAVAQAGPGEALIAAAAFVDRAPFAAYRIELRSLTSGPAVGVDPAVSGSFAVSISPNPGLHGTAIRFVVPEPGPVKIDLFDVRGRLVRSVLDKTMPAGHAEIRWNGDDAIGRPAQAGIYFLRVQMSGVTKQLRVVKL